MSRMLGGIAVVLGLGLGFAAPASATVYTVDTTGDGAATAGCAVEGGADCTLRGAILSANANAGPDEVAFALPVGNTIAPATPLPQVTGTVTIDGTTQALQGRVELDGSGAGTSASGLVISAGSSTVRGLAINDFALNGVQLLTNGGNLITGNRIGTDQAGSTAHPNGAAGIQVASGDGNTISGNVVSGNATGILVSAPGTQVTDNRVGTDAAGTVALGNFPGRGVQLNAGSTAAVVSGNLISGNASDGVVIGASVAGATLTGNLIGTDAGGTADLGNGTGVTVSGSGATIGGTTAAARNVISGSSGYGIDLGGSGNAVLGNRIGTNREGTGAIANGDDGIRVASGSGNAIGAAADGSGNLISGNAGDGVSVAGGDSLTIRGNRIGTTAGGDTALANTAAGVNVGNGGNLVEGNRIAFNGHDGIQVSGGNGNRFQGNSLTANGEGAGDLGIDLDANGVSPNDASPDSDLGANGLQNFPVLSLAESAGGTLSVSGVLHSALASTYRIELFSSPSCDPAGHGEGATFLEGFDATTDGAGEATFTRTLARDVPVGAVITATATSAGGSTSELGPCTTVAAGSTTPPAITIADATVPEGDSGTNSDSFVLTLDHASGQAVSVDFATSDGTAVAGSDYVAKSATATFAPGAIQAIVTVAVTGDTLDEPDETFTATLSGAQNATITDGTATGTITDDDSPPSVSVGDVSVPEPASGTATASLAVTLSAASGKTVTVAYATADGTAHAGSDYTAKTGTVTFAPGDMSKTVSVDVHADSADEPDETFTVGLANPTGATLGDALGTATIEATPPAVSMVDVEKSEPDPGVFRGGLVYVEPRLSRPYSHDVTVTLEGQDGTATSPADYSDGGTRMVTIKAGDLYAAQSDDPQAHDGMTVVVNTDSLSEPDETMTVAITGVSGGATIGDDTGLLTIHDTTPTISMIDTEMAEPDPGVFHGGVVWVEPRLSRPYTQDIKVTLEGQDATATFPADWDDGGARTVTFKAGETFAGRPSLPLEHDGLPVVVATDSLSEPDETMNVVITKVTGGAAIADGSGLLTIHDTTPTISMIDASKFEPDPGQPQNGLVWVEPRLSRPYTQNISVTLEGRDGTATFPADWDDGGARTVTFKAGETFAGRPSLPAVHDGLPVVVASDLLAEPDETMDVVITKVTGGAAIADGTGVLTIHNKGGKPVFGPATEVVLGGPSSSGGAGGTTVVVTPGGIAPIVVVNKNPFPVTGKLGLTITVQAKHAAAAAMRRIPAGRATFKLGAHRKTAVKLRLSKRARKLLGSRRKLAAKATLTLTDPAGTKRKMSRTLRLIRRRG